MVIFSQTLIIQLHKFFDKHPDSIQLEALIKACEINSENKSIKQEYEALLKAHKEVIKNLRNKVYAHTDIHSFPEDLFENIKTTYTDLLDIINSLEQIMKDIGISLQITRLPHIDADIVQREHVHLVQMVVKALKQYKS